jgi:chemotaxis protein methyltransferase CheR
MTATLSDADIVGLSVACDLDLANFRRTHVEARVARALEQERAENVAELRDRLTTTDAAREAFRRSVAISVTGLFRDAEQFEQLAEALRAEPKKPRPPRVWSAGCATGEESWSLAALLARLGRADGALVLGSDLLPENVRAARRLRPTARELGGVVIPATMRVRFECRDLVHDGAPGTGWDIVLCRNVAIYLEEARRRQVHRTLALALARQGLLLLGRSERLSDPAALGLRRLSPHLYLRCEA